MVRALFCDYSGPIQLVLAEIPLRGGEQHGRIRRSRLDGGLDQLLLHVTHLGVVVEPGHRKLGLNRLRFELFRLLKLVDRLLRLAQLEENDAHALMGARIAGVEADPRLEMLVGQLPLLASWFTLSQALPSSHPGAVPRGSCS